VKRLLKNGRVVDPASATDAELDILIEDGHIASMEESIEPGKNEVVDLAGLTVCPGFIDMHVHFREPGQEWKETVATGAAAAASGGFTAVACMPNTVPVMDNRSLVEFVQAQAREAGMARVWPIGAVTKGQDGKELAEIGDMTEAGAVAFSDDGRPIRSSQIMRMALEYSKIFGVPVIDHCEDPELVDGGVVHEGWVSSRLGFKGWPGVAEDIMVGRNILLSEYTGGHVHIAHMSTSRSAPLFRDSKSRGSRVTCDVTPHHLVLDHEAVMEFDTYTKMNPPLRSAEDLEGLLEGLADGTVDAIATDHAPHHCDEKCVEFSRAPFGVVGLETAVSICLDRLVHRDVVSLNRMVELFTTGPAGVLGLDKGKLAAGAEADITVLDLDRAVTVDPDHFESKSENSPFLRWELKGGPVMTMVDGRIIHDRR
jgi:dihydroorotase